MTIRTTVEVDLLEMIHNAGADKILDFMAEYSSIEKYNPEIAPPADKLKRFEETLRSCAEQWRELQAISFQKLDLLRARDRV